MRSEAIRLRLKGAMRRQAAKRRSDDLPGRQSLSRHSSRALTAMCSTRWATRLQTPQPAKAIATAAKPLASEAAKETLDSSAKRNCRVKIVCWMTHRALTGSSRKNTGATLASSGIA